MPRIIGQYEEPPRKATLKDARGIGCWAEYIELEGPGRTTLLLDFEKQLASQILGQCGGLLPSIVLLPCRIDGLWYAQCSFDGGYKEASGKNNFLREGRIVSYMRLHNVATLVAATPALAEALYALGEPRIEETLYLALGVDRPPVRYEVVRDQVLADAQLEQERQGRQQTWFGKLSAYVRGVFGVES